MQPLIPFFDRVTIQVGSLRLGGFGVMVAAGFLVGAQLSRRKLARGGYDPGLITPLLGLIAIGVYVGGHIGHVISSHPEAFATEGERFVRLLSALANGRLPNAHEIPMLLKVWEGLSSYGGFVVCTTMVLWYLRHNKAPLLPYGDAVMYGLATSWALARVGCFLAHDHPGVETQFWLGVRGICPGTFGNSRIACHDLGLYEAILSVAIAIGFAIKDRTPRQPGYFIGLGCVWYAPARFLLDFLRHPTTEIRYAGLTTAQYGSIILTCLGIYLLWRSWRGIEERSR